MQETPDGISEESYWVLLYLLYDYLADENLALVMSDLVEKEMGTIENDIYKVCKMQFDDKLVHDVKSRLDAQGFKEWQEEEFQNENMYNKHRI